VVVLSAGVKDVIFFGLAMLDAWTLNALLKNYSMENSPLQHVQSEDYACAPKTAARET